MTVRRRGPVLALVAAALCGGGCGDGAEATGGDCLAVMTWQGREYIGHGGHARTGEAVGTGTVPDCTSEAVLERPTLYRLRNVPVEIAVGGDDGLWLATGYYPALASHPLHRRLIGPSEPARSCRGRWAATGTISHPRGPTVRTATGEIGVELHGRTRVRGPKRFGTAYLERGDRVRLRGRWCSDFAAGRRRFADEVVILAR